MAKGKKKTELPKSTAQQLGSIVKSCRDIMRKDKGLNGDLDRLPMLTWIMFLKFLDDMEEMRREEANLAGKKFRQAIEPPYRWRDWAAKPDGMTGSELIAFINQEEAVRPDGRKGAGLFAYLRGLQSSNGDRRDVIAKVFDGTVNRMINGYLLRDVVNRVNEIHFASQDEIHTLGHLYESMLREMRDAAGDSGEFYTPRALVKFVVAVVDPRLGETVLDPAAGTGGFLVEAFEHLRKQSKKAEDFTRLQEGTLHGIEPKPLPYLLCQMNLLLHGVEYPEIDPGNALRSPLREIGDKDRVGIIMTNPPFGGEEERGILSTSPKTSRQRRPPCFSYSSSCGNLGAQLEVRTAADAAWSYRTASSSGRVFVLGSRRNYSRSLTCTRLCACQTECSPPTPASVQTFCSLTGRGQRRKSGTTSSRCPRVGRITPRQRPSNSRNSMGASRGGRSAKRMSVCGRLEPLTF